MSRKKIIIANWKSNPDSPGRAAALAKKIESGILKSKHVEVVIAPPSPFLIPVSAVLKKAKLGAQDVFWDDIGPHTGEVSWHQLKHLSVSFCIVGHSERRIRGETDDMINKKVRSLLEHGITPILCIGERERVGNEIPTVVEEQLHDALRGVKRSFIKNLVVTYEPVWAISTTVSARADTPDNAFRARVYIQKILVNRFGSEAKKVRIIYGGSVHARNIGGFLREGKMDGALVGGASLHAEEFITLVRNAAAIQR